MFIKHVCPICSPIFLLIPVLITPHSLLFSFPSFSSILFSVRFDAAADAMNLPALRGSPRLCTCTVRFHFGVQRLKSLHKLKGLRTTDSQAWEPMDRHCMHFYFCSLLTASLLSTFIEAVLLGLRAVLWLLLSMRRGTRICWDSSNNSQYQLCPILGKLL